MILRFIAICLLFITFLYSKSIEFNQDDVKLSILEKSYMYIDENSTLAFKNIKNIPFKKSDTNYIKLGYTNATIWVKFILKNNSTEDLERYLTLTNPILDTIELFIKNGNSYTKETKGVLHLDLYKRNNIILHPSFKINFKAGETKEFYYKIHSLSCANYFKLFLKDQTQLYKDEFSYQLVETLFIGAIIAFIVYNTFIFIFTKEIAYLYYVLYLFFICVNHTSYSNISTYYISKEFAEIEAFAALYYITLINIFSILFIRTILQIQKFKKINYVLNLSIILNLTLVIISFYYKFLIAYVTLLVFLSMLFLLFVCIYSYLKKQAQAKYIITGWLINIIGMIMLAFKDSGAWTIIDYYPYFYELTVFLEAVLFSVALASKLNKTKELETSLKTNELLTKELHHRVKNNMQFIILMYRLKLANHSNEEIDQKLKEIEGSIQAISKTHEILYNQENLENIDSQEYFENLIEEFKRSYSDFEIEIKLNIQENLDIQHSIYCGIILNELLTNSFKYAFKNKKGKIKISLKKELGKYIFMVQDDGIGFDYEKKKEDSFGLSFIKAIAQDELNGDIEFSSNNGAMVKIVF